MRSIVKNIQYFFPVVILLSLASCHSLGHKRSYRIGVSQCSGDVWRCKMNRELNDELVFHPDLTLSFRQAEDNSQLQCQQIDSFIRERVDLLIVCPNEAVQVRPAVERAMDAHIPVIIADRRIPGNKWTAFVGGDNRQVGLLMAQWLGRLSGPQKRPVRVLEITGNMSTTPAILRHEGLMEGLRRLPEVKVIASACGAWKRDVAEIVCDSLLVLYPDIDAVVTQSDLMAIGVADAIQRHESDALVLGVDGISGEGGGIEAVLNKRIAVTATYPSRGDLILQRAAQILHGEPFSRETNLLSVLVGPEEAKPIAMMYSEYEAQMSALLRLRANANHLTEHYNLQKVVIWLLAVMVVMLIVFSICLWRLAVGRHRMLLAQQQKDSQLERQQKMLHHLEQQLSKMEEEIPTAAEEEQQFVSNLSHEIELQIANPELSVELLASNMGMSRSVLFRRTKLATGLSPVELVRRIRMQRAEQLLKGGTLTVQEVAYDVGFSSAAYFARCYKETYGVTPGDEKKK